MFYLCITNDRDLKIHSNDKIFHIMCTQWRIFPFYTFSNTFTFSSQWAKVYIDYNIPVSWEEKNSGIMVHSELPWQIIVFTINAREYDVLDGTEVSCYCEVDVGNDVAESAIWGMVQKYHCLEQNRKWLVLYMYIQNLAAVGLWST